MARKTRLPKQYVVAGRPVPFITAWSAEMHAARRTRARISESQGGSVEVRIIPLDGGQFVHAADMVGATQAGDWWWNEPPQARGQGEPVWAEVHAGRQRSCMRRFRCQVCSIQLPTPSPSSPVTWLVTKVHREGHLVLDPPTCAPCRELSERLCPSLRREKTLLTVRSADLDWGVWGTQTLIDPQGRPSKVSGILGHRDDEGDRETILAKQAVAQLLNYDVDAHVLA